MDETVFETLYTKIRNPRKQKEEINNILKNYTDEEIKLFIKNYMVRNAGVIATYFKSFEESQNDIKLLNGIEKDYSRYFWKIHSIRTAYLSINHPCHDTAKSTFSEEEMYLLTNENILNFSSDLLDKVYHVNMDHLDPQFDFVEPIDIENHNRFKLFTTIIAKKDLIKKTINENDYSQTGLISALLDKIKIEYKNREFPLKALEDDVGFKNKYFSMNLDKLTAFKPYDSKIISDKASFEIMEKIAFARNLYEYISTGIFVFKYSSELSPFPDEETKKQADDDLKYIYENFDEGKFLNMQKNVVFSPLFPHTYSDSVYSHAYSVEGDTTHIGLLVTTKPFDELVFISMKISGSGDSQRYEIQYNKLLENKLENRVQMLRLDNYTQPGTHKNIGGTKLDTTTHIHIYNPLDVIRGKINGGYDIAYNIEQGSMPFSDALDIFSNIFNFNNSLKEDIKSTISNIMKSQVNTIQSTRK